MSLQVYVIFVLIGLASSFRSEELGNKRQCVDNTLYAKYVCENQKDGEKVVVPGKCSEYYECSKGISLKKSCSKFFDPRTQKCVSTSTCVEVDDTDCVIPTPPPSYGTSPSPPTTCDCPTAPAPAPATCAPPAECPEPPKCPPPTECPTPPPTCPEVPTEPSSKPPTESTPKPQCSSSPSGRPCGNWFDPNDLYGSFVCRNKSDGTKLIALLSCKDYYYCIGGNSYRKSCGNSLYFNPKVGACDKKSNVYCLPKQNLVQ